MVSYETVIGIVLQRKKGYRRKGVSYRGVWSPMKPALGVVCRGMGSIEEKGLTCEGKWQRRKGVHKKGG